MNNAETALAETQHDRRRAPRRKVFKLVQIVSPDKLSVLDCSLRSVSPHGALIAGQYMVDLPDRFFIRTTAQLKLVSCEVVRRTLTSVAVRFQDGSGKLADGR